MHPTLTTSPSLFKAFADPTRLRLLNLLLEGEVCVCHLGDVLGLSQPMVSRHLAYLRRSGLVRARREGKWMHYAIIDEPDPLSCSLLNCVRTCLRDADELQNDLTLLRGKCCVTASNCENANCD